VIVLDYQDRRPIYEQVTDKFQILILNLPPGSQMPSVRQLATELSVNPNTIQRAYMELEKLGLIYPVKGRGNFVADSSQVQKINRESYRKEFTALIQKGRNTGFNREELEKMLAEIFEKEDES
jgi:GntR family transcriptional regulator